MYARRAEVHPALMRSQQLNVAVGPQTYLHGDVHPGNWYVTGEGLMGLYDCQLNARGGLARDLAYALTTHLAVKARREWERDLLDRYLGKLDEAGVKPEVTREELFPATASRSATRCSRGSRRSGAAHSSRNTSPMRSRWRTLSGSPRPSPTWRASRPSGSDERHTAPDESRRSAP